MTGFRLQLVFISTFCILFGNCYIFIGGRISQFMPGHESWYKTCYKNTVNELGECKSIFTGKSSGLLDIASTANKHVEDFLSDNVCNPVGITMHQVYDKLKGTVDKASKAMPAVNTYLEKPTAYYKNIKEGLKDSSWNPFNKSYSAWFSNTKNQVSSALASLPNQIPIPNKDTLKSYIINPAKNIVSDLNKPTGHTSFYRRMQDKFAHLKGYLLKKSYDISNYFYHLYFRGVGRVEDFVVGRMCHPLTKIKYPLATKFLCKVENLLKENATRNNEYLVISAAKNIMKDIRKPTSGIFSESTSLLNTKQNAISSSLSSLSNQVSIPNTDYLRKYITNSAKDLVPDLEKPTSYYNSFKKSMRSSSWNPINKLSSPWLDKKKNQMTSTLASVQIPIPEKDEFIKSITNPAKDLVHKIGEPSTPYNHIKNKLKTSSWNTLSEFYPSWLLKKKNQTSSSATALPFQDNGTKPYVTGSSKSIFNRFVWNPLGNRVSASFSKIESFFIPSFLRNWGAFVAASGTKFAFFGLGIVAVIAVVMAHRCMKHLAGEYEIFMDIYDPLDNVNKVQNVTDSLLEVEEERLLSSEVDIEETMEEENTSGKSASSQTPDLEDEKASQKETASSLSQTMAKSEKESSTQTLPSPGRTSTTQTTQADTHSQSAQTEPQKIEPGKTEPTPKRKSSMRPNVLMPNI